jgi:hypothetical protein
MPPRTLPEIDADLAATRKRLADLEAERKLAVQHKREAVVKAFDDGASRQQIVAAFDLTYTTVAHILSQAGRSEKQRRALGLSPLQLAEYQRLLRAGVPSKTARAIAETVGSRYQQASTPAAHREGAPA